MMKLLAVLLCTALFASTSLGRQDDDGDEDRLPPILKGVDLHGHMAPLLPGSSTDKPLIGRPDGHEPTPGDMQTEKPLIGRPDGHEPTPGDTQTEKQLIGRPDGHEPGRLLGRPDGHERSDKDANGQIDGHDSTGEEVPSEAGVDDGDEPLIRCKRPFCSCDNFEFQTDATGCPVCKCLEHPCQNVKCSDGEICRQIKCDDAEPCTTSSVECIPVERSCPEPMCANYCPNGYAHNEEGCMTCTCLTESAPEEAQNDPSACPMVMCATFCPGEYKRNEHGCMTCDCVDEVVEDSLCGEAKCDVGQICRLESEAYCAPKPMCLLAQEMAYMKRDRQELTRMFVPTCEKDGAFKPMQCHEMMSECWCVDDRGKEIDGTRSPMTSDDDKLLHCEPNVTVAVHMHMTLTYLDHRVIYDNLEKDEEGDEDEDKDDAEDDDDYDEDFVLNLNKSHGVLQETFSTWLLVDKQYISVIKVEQNSKNQVLVQLLVISGGPVDLPSAVEHMKRKMRMGDCNVPLENLPQEEEVYFTPDVDSLNINHEYYSEPGMTLPVVPDGPREWYKYCFGDYHILLVVATMLVLFLILGLFSALMVHRHRRNHRSFLFRHHRLENQLSQEQKNFVNDEVAIDTKSESAVNLVSAYDLEKKLPIA